MKSSTKWMLGLGAGLGALALLSQGGSKDEGTRDEWWNTNRKPSSNAEVDTISFVIFGDNARRLLESTGVSGLIEHAGYGAVAWWAGSKEDFELVAKKASVQPVESISAHGSEKETLVVELAVPKQSMKVNRFTASNAAREALANGTLSIRKWHLSTDDAALFEAGFRS